MQKTGLILGQEDSLEKEMAIHSSLLAWEIPWTEDPGGLHSPWGHKRDGHNLATQQQQQIKMYYVDLLT